jgi:hypothetical protein
VQFTPFYGAISSPFGAISSPLKRKNLYFKHTYSSTNNKTRENKKKQQTAGG